MNKVLYADSDTGDFKSISSKVWILATQPIPHQVGADQYVSLSSALQTAVQYKIKPLETKRPTVRFIHNKPSKLKMVQATRQASRVSSLSKAIKKAIQIKHGRGLEKIGPNVIDGANVWTITSQAQVLEVDEQKQHADRQSPFAAALTRLQKNEKTPLINRPKRDTPHTEAAFFTATVMPYRSFQDMSAMG